MFERITYSERANWYLQETYSAEQNEFIRKLMISKNIKYPTIIPCNSGKNLKTLSEVSNCVYAFDANTQMIENTKAVIKSGKLYNCLVEYGDMLEFKLPRNSDAVLILNEAMQMFKSDSRQFGEILHNILQQLSGILVLELFDFKTNSKVEQLRYFSTGTVNTIVYDFQFSNGETEVKRFHKTTHTKYGIIVRYYYLINDSRAKEKRWLTSEVELFHYNIERIKALVEHYGGIIEQIYTSYSGSADKSLGKRILVIRSTGRT